MATVNVKKSDGSLEPLNLNKIIRWSKWATLNCPDISLEALLTSNNIIFYDGISTYEITDSICKNCETLAAIESLEANYSLAQQYLDVARNLYIPSVIKKANIWQSKHFNNADIYSQGIKIGDNNVIPLARYKTKSVIQLGLSIGCYDNLLLNGSLHEDLFDFVDQSLDYTRVNFLPYGGMKQLEAKYLAKKQKQIIEDPQQHFAILSLALVHAGANVYDEGLDLEFQKNSFTKYYNTFSQAKGNNPTPFSHNIRSPRKQYDSCTLYEIGDSIPEIRAGMDVTTAATVAGAGIGVSLGAIRAEGTFYKNTGIHGGLGPYLSQLSANVNGSNQETRGGSATINFPIWHRDAFPLMMAKDNTAGTEGVNRWRHLDYCIHFNNELLNRLPKNEKILLVSPHEKTKSGKTVYEAFYNVDENGKYDPSEYLEYEAEMLARDDLFYINSSNIETATAGIPVYTRAYDLFSTLVSQIMSTGRIYTLNATHVNNHSPYLDAVKMTNLCVEITQPTNPISYNYDSKDHTMLLNDGEVSFCQLGAIVLGNVAFEEIPEVTETLLRTQEAVFNISDYSSIPYSHKQKKRRNVGIGIVNLHHLLTKEVFSVYPEKDWYDKVGEVCHKYFEAIQYYLLDASAELAKELGPCEMFDRTKYSKGFLPIDTCTNTKLNSYPLLQDWEALRAKIKKYGLRFSSHSASMPVESSSVPFGLINGKESPKTPITFKGNKVLSVAIAVPEMEKLGQYYLYAWDNKKVDKNKINLIIESNHTKFQDQSSSFNIYWDLSVRDKVPELELFETILFAPAREGIKTMYYNNFNTDRKEDNSEEVSETKVEQLKKEALAAADDGCASGMCKL